MNKASWSVRDIPPDLAKMRRKAKSMNTQLEVAKTEIEKGRGWNPEKETASKSFKTGPLHLTRR